MKDKDIFLFNKDIVVELEKQTTDVKTKNFLRFKVCVAEVLNKTIPLFMDMTPEEIIRNCLDPVNEDKLTMDVYSAKFKGTDVLDFREDLILKIKLPHEITFFGSSYIYAFFNFEGQTYIPSYPLFNRILAYNADSFLKESKFQDIKTTKEFYEKAIPIVTFFINDFDQGENDIDYFFLTHKKGIDVDNKIVLEDKETFDLPAVVVLNVGKNGGEDFKNIYGYLHYLIKKSKDDINDMFKYYGYSPSKKEEKTMLVSKALEDSFNEGQLKGMKKTISSFLRFELNNGSTKEKAFEKIVAIDPSSFNYDLLEEVYSSLND